MNGLRATSQGENLQTGEDEAELVEMILDLRDSIHTLYETHASASARFAPIRPAASLSANQGPEPVGLVRNAAPQP